MLHGCVRPHRTDIVGVLPRRLQISRLYGSARVPFAGGVPPRLPQHVVLHGSACPCERFSLHYDSQTTAVSSDPHGLYRSAAEWWPLVCMFAAVSYGLCFVLYAFLLPYPVVCASFCVHFY